MISTLMFKNCHFHPFHIGETCIFLLPEDRPLIVQFAANNSQDFADAAEIVSP